MYRLTRAAAAAALLSTASPAFAQTASSWSGFYAGVHGGYGEMSMSASSTDQVNQVTNVNPAGAQPLTVVPSTTVALNGEQDESDYVYGGFAGFTMQSGNLVYGLEADVSGPRDAFVVAGTATVPATALSPMANVSMTREGRPGISGSLRARLGVALNRTLVYGTAGIASQRLRMEATNFYNIPAGTSTTGVAAPAFGPFVATAEERRTLTGWTAGGGIEQQIGRSIGIGLDARYADYGSKTFNLANPSVSTLGPSPVFTGAEGGTGNPLSPTPNATPGATRTSFSDFRVALRLMFRFR